jgi:hypothetical protein
MARKPGPDITWLPDVEDRDFLAAASFLGLLYREERVADPVARLKSAVIVSFAAKDIFRASHLSSLGMGNSHVEKDRKKIDKGVPISPHLLVRHEANGQVVVADGYHRLCAIYAFDEDAWIHCKIV